LTNISAHRGSEFLQDLGRGYASRLVPGILAIVLGELTAGVCKVLPK